MEGCESRDAHKERLLGTNFYSLFSRVPCASYDLIIAAINGGYFKIQAAMEVSRPQAPGGTFPLYFFC